MWTNAMSRIPTENHPPPGPPRVVAISGTIFAVLYIAGLRTAISPRWMVFVGYALALVMLLTITDFAWLALLFPLWVLLLSTYILIADFQQGRRMAAK